jgi:prolyl-tRNA editing enzyme YbaK/EbsC (Cys-tRNA(Pro) deacylase)
VNTGSHDEQRMLSNISRCAEALEHIDVHLGQIAKTLDPIHTTAEEHPVLILVNQANDSTYVTARELAKYRQVVLVYRDDDEVAVKVLKDNIGSLDIVDVTP